MKLDEFSTSTSLKNPFMYTPKKNLLAMAASQNEEREKKREMKEFNAHTELAVANSRQKADSGMKCSFFLPALANP